jgi:uncharacterized protein YjbI with pentapeptide repeats
MGRRADGTGQPHSPYPPDVSDEAMAPAALGDLTDLVVNGADWANERSSRLTLRRVELHLCRLTGAALGEAALTDVTVVDCQLDLAVFRFAKLERVVFRDCRMRDCDFYEASLRDVLFERCELHEATFTAAKAQRVEMRACDLTALRGVEALRGVRMPWNDVLANAPLFATVVGIEIVD